MVAQPDDAMLKQGVRKRLYCDTQGDKPLEFTWTKDDRPLGLAASGAGRRQASNQLPAVSVVELDADSSVLTISNLSAVHAGRYECAARNGAGVARTSVRLFVQGKVPSVARLDRDAQPDESPVTRIEFSR